MNELGKLRGMSEPLAFSFNVMDKGRSMLVHAVVFTSFEASDDTTVKLAEPDDDPRMPVFVKFCMDNYGKKAREGLEKMVESLARDIEKRRSELKQLEHEINRLRKENHVE